MMKPYLIISYIILCLVIGAWADALFDSGVKLWAHSLGALEILLLLSGAFVFNLRRKDWVVFIVTFILWRVVGFDYLYNLFRGLEWDYIGSTSNWDLFLSKQQGIIFGRIIFLIGAIFIPIQYKWTQNS